MLDPILVFFSIKLELGKNKTILLRVRLSILGKIKVLEFGSEIFICTKSVSLQKILYLIVHLKMNFKSEEGMKGEEGGHSHSSFVTSS